MAKFRVIKETGLKHDDYWVQEELSDGWFNLTCTSDESQALEILDELVAKAKHKSEKIVIKEVDTDE